MHYSPKSAAILVSSQETAKYVKTIVVTKNRNNVLNSPTFPEKKNLFKCWSGVVIFRDWQWSVPSSAESKNTKGHKCNTACPILWYYVITDVGRPDAPPSSVFLSFFINEPSQLREGVVCANKISHVFLRTAPAEQNSTLKDVWRNKEIRKAS